MPPSKRPSSLKSEVSKLAKLSNLQGGLPPLMRGLPVLAILAGGVISKATNGSNIIEYQMLGADETVLLSSPITEVSATTAGKIKEWTRDGVKMMCSRCGKREMEDVASSQNRWLRAEELSSIYLDYNRHARLRRDCQPGMSEWDRHPQDP